jgi:hypothetical protein
VISHNGTAAKPIVFRAMKGERVTIQGIVEMSGTNTWLWGVEVTDPNNVGNMVGSGIQIIAPGVHLINNVVHHEWDKSGVNAWNYGPGQVLYGNIIYENGQNTNGGHPHGVYTQNDFSSNGYKYFVNNMFMDSAKVCEDCFNFHAYTTNNHITGFHVEKNFVANGKFIIGGYGDPTDRHVVQNNYYYSSRVSFGFARPAQTIFKDNYLGKTGLIALWFWGQGETIFTQTAPNEFTGNSFINPTTNHVQFRTSAYLNTGKCQGCPPIQAQDLWNDNVYTKPFRGYFQADNTRLSGINFSTWKSATANAGNAFDTNSIEEPPPTVPKIVLIPNEYELGRGHLAIYNWKKASSVNVNLSSVVAIGKSYAIYKYNSSFSSPVITGTYSGPVNVPMAGLEYQAFVVKTLN